MLCIIQVTVVIIILLWNLTKYTSQVYSCSTGKAYIMWLTHSYIYDVKTENCNFSFVNLLDMELVLPMYKMQGKGMEHCLWMSVWNLCVSIFVNEMCDLWWWSAWLKKRFKRHHQALNGFGWEPVCHAASYITGICIYHLCMCLGVASILVGVILMCSSPHSNYCSGKVLCLAIIVLNINVSH